jgi:hypothetical protein
LNPSYEAIFFCLTISTDKLGKSDVDNIGVKPMKALTKIDQDPQALARLNDSMTQTAQAANAAGARGVCRSYRLQSGEHHSPQDCGPFDIYSVQRIKQLTPYLIMTSGPIDLASLLSVR